MRYRSPDDIESIASETVGGLRRLCDLWATRGAAALDEAVRGEC